jgi:hypothetical protein
MTKDRAGHTEQVSIWVQIATPKANAEWTPGTY